MHRKINLTGNLLAGVVYLILADVAHAQQWYNTTQNAPSATAVGSSEEKSNWRFTVGGGTGYAPVYDGSDKYKAIPIPVLDIDYRDELLFVNVRNGIGSYLIRGEDYKIGAALGYAPGRKEDDDKNNLRGMGDVDASATVSLLGEYNFGFVNASGKVTTAISGDYGTTATFNLGSRRPVIKNIVLSASIGTTWADEQHMSSRFGITAGQATRSGYGQYDAKSGFKSVGFSVGATYLLTEQWNANLTFRGEKLLGDAADSPIVKDGFVPAVFLTTSYRF